MRGFAGLSVAIKAFTKPHGGYWIEKAYRLPVGIYAATDRFLTQENDKNTPITEMAVNSLITNLHDGETLTVGKSVEVQGIAWDVGHGARFAWRQWLFPFTSSAIGHYAVMAHTTNTQGMSQMTKLVFSPEGYNNNGILTFTVEAA